MTTAQGANTMPKETYGRHPESLLDVYARTDDHTSWRQFAILDFADAEAACAAGNGIVAVNRQTGQVVFQSEDAEGLAF